MARTGRSHGALETEVLASLGAARSPRTVQQVLDDVDPSLAYTTVMTTLSRLHAKGAIERERSGRAFVYTLAGGPSAARASMTAHSMHRLLENGADRKSVLSRFVSELSPADEKMLRRMLEQQSTGPQTSGQQPADRA